MSSKPKERLIENALKLFCQHGFFATGIDTILAEAKVSKTTLYRNFRSKEELIIAALRRQDESFRNWFMQAVDKAFSDPVDRVIAVFDIYQSWAEREEFNGCAFVKASAEYPSIESPIHAICAEHKRLMMRYIQSLIEAAEIQDSANVATQFMVLLDGATVLAQIMGESHPFQQAKESAQKLISSTY
ncbi:MAG: TetR/AcrR family transcriptional regulator [Thainema sp.]